MSTALFANNASALLASGINSSTTTIVVATGKGALYPSPTGGNFFMATLAEGTTIEIVKVTARSGDTMTVLRGQESTASSAFTTAAVFEVRVTSGVLNLFAQGSINSPPYINLANNSGAPLSGSNEVNVRANNGVLEVSENGAGYVLVGKPDQQSYSAASGNLNPSLKRETTIHINMNANLLINNPTLTGDAVLALGLGTRLELVFIQDNTGGRTITWGAKFINASTLLPRLGPGQRSAIVFVLSADGNWTRESADCIDFSRPVFVEDFGAVGDGSTDSTAGLARAFAFFSGNTSTGGATIRGGKLVLSQGQYLTSQTLQYTGRPGDSWSLVGQGAGSAFLKGSEIKYTGSTSGNSRVIRMQGATNTYLADFSIDANGAMFGLQDEGFIKTYPTNFSGSTHNVRERLAIGGIAGDGSSCYLVSSIPSEVSGGVDTLQTDDLTFVNCWGTGSNNADEESNIFLNLMGGNAKNYVIRGGQFLVFRFGVNGLGTSSSCLVDGAFFGDCTGAASSPGYLNAGAVFKQGSGSLEINNVECEGTSRARFLFQDAAFGSLANGHITITNCEMDAPCPAPSDDAGGDVMLWMGGNASIVNSKFNNTRTGSSLAKINGNYEATTNTSLTCHGSQFSWASGDLPLYDGDNQLINEEFGIGTGVNVYAWANNGGDPDGAPVRLNDINGRLPQTMQLKMSQTQKAFIIGGSGGLSSVPINGESNTASLKYTVNLRDMKTAALSNVGELCHLKANMVLKTCRMRVTEAVAGLSGTLTANIGTDNPPTGDIVLPTVISGSLPQYTTKQDFGAELADGIGLENHTGADLVMYLKITSSVGNLSNLTAGIVDIVFEYSLLP